MLLLYLTLLSPTSLINYLPRLLLQKSWCLQFFFSSRNNSKHKIKVISRFWENLKGKRLPNLSSDWLNWVWLESIPNKWVSNRKLYLIPNHIWLITNQIVLLRLEEKSNSRLLWKLGLISNVRFSEWYIIKLWIVVWNIRISFIIMGPEVCPHSP